MINSSDRWELLRKTSLGVVYLGWYLFGIALTLSINLLEERDVSLIRFFLTAAGWLVTAGVVLGYGLARRKPTPQRRLNLFRVFRWMDRLEAFFAPVGVVTATSGGRIGVGVVSGFVVLAILSRVV